MEPFVQVGIFLVCLCAVIAIFVLGYCIYSTCYIKRRNQKKEDIQKTVLENSAYYGDPQPFTRESEIPSDRKPNYPREQADTEFVPGRFSKKGRPTSYYGYDAYNEDSKIDYRNPYGRPPPKSDKGQEAGKKHSLRASKSTENITQIKSHENQKYDGGRGMGSRSRSNQNLQKYDGGRGMGNRSRSHQNLYDRNEDRDSPYDRRHLAQQNHLRRDHTVSTDRRGFSRTGNTDLPTANYEYRNVRKENPLRDDGQVLRNEYKGQPTSKYGQQNLRKSSTSSMDRRVNSRNYYGNSSDARNERSYYSQSLQRASPAYEDRGRNIDNDSLFWYKRLTKPPGYYPNAHTKV